MNKILFSAVLSMDAYNRGYDAEVSIDGSTIGAATILMDSGVLVDINSERLDQPASFYALAYNYGGETIVSYRGTDSATDSLAYPIATGVTNTTQGEMAFQFYNAVATSLNGCKYS